MKYILLFDNQRNDKNFISEKIDKPLTIYYSPETKKKIVGWTLGVLKVIFNTQRNDTIICWFDFQAVLCFWICKLLFLQRNFICINIMLKDKPTLKNKIVSYLYKKALMNKKFKASVTSDEYGKWVNLKLGINAKYKLIHDVYHEFYNYKTNKTISQTVFCGGANGRDWLFMLKIAQAMPNINFNIILPNKIYKKIRTQIPKNVIVKYDIPYKEFMEELCKSSLVCLPLNTQAPAGLIVMFQAAANNKLVLTTKTVTTIEYITPERGILIENDINIWCKTINKYLYNKKEANNKANNFKKFLQESCSEDLFVQNLKEILQ